MTTTPHCSACEVHAESTFTVEGMDCREEVALIERRFRSLPGLEEFNADVIARRLHVRYDASKLSTAAITAAVADAGMRAWLEHEEPVGGTDPQASRRRWIRLAGAAAAFAGGALLEPGAPSWVPPLLYSLTVLLGLPDPA
ncbi:MAG: cation transporter, partial [Vicinamibacterales bacterium]